MRPGLQRSGEREPNGACAIGWRFRFPGQQEHTANTHGHPLPLESPEQHVHTDGVGRLPGVGVSDLTSYVGGIKRERRCFLRA